MGTLETCKRVSQSRTTRYDPMSHRSGMGVCPFDKHRGGYAIDISHVVCFNHSMTEEIPWGPFGFLAQRINNPTNNTKATSLLPSSLTWHQQSEQFSSHQQPVSAYLSHHRALPCPATRRGSGSRPRCWRRRTLEPVRAVPALHHCFLRRGKLGRPSAPPPPRPPKVTPPHCPRPPRPTRWTQTTGASPRLRHKIRHRPHRHRTSGAKGG